jgi:hypothetical protein
MNDPQTTLSVLGVLAIVAGVLFGIGLWMKYAHQADAQLIGDTISRRRQRAIDSSPARIAGRKNSNAT